jgi:hypothetical protein
LPVFGELVRRRDEFTVFGNPDDGQASTSRQLTGISAAYIQSNGSIGHQLALAPYDGIAPSEVAKAFGQQYEETLGNLQRASSQFNACAVEQLDEIRSEAVRRTRTEKLHIVSAFAIYSTAQPRSHSTVTFVPTTVAEATSLHVRDLGLHAANVAEDREQQQTVRQIQQNGRANTAMLAAALVMPPPEEFGRLAMDTAYRVVKNRQTQGITKDHAQSLRNIA